MPLLFRVIASPRRYARRAISILQDGRPGLASTAERLLERRLRFDLWVRERQLRFDLWGGAEDVALARLESILASRWSSSGARLGAGCTLATWLDFKGYPDRALSVLESLESCVPSDANSHKRTMRLAALLHRGGDTAAARAVLGRTRIPSVRVATDCALARANLADDDEERLEAINGRLRRRELAELRRIDPARPLALENIEATAGSCALPDLGKVSVIMPAFNAEATIATALRSLIRQSYPNLEIIVVDDCSTDATAEIVAGMARGDGRIRLVRQPENRGAYPARNRGLAEACGDFITTHDADDWSHPQKIELQLATLAPAPELVGVMSYWARIRPPFQFTTNWRLGHEIVHWSHSSFLFRRAVRDRVGSWDEVRVSADTEYIWRVERVYGPQSIRKIMADVPLAFALDDESSLTRHKLTHVRTTYHGLRHYYREISRYWQERHPEGLPPEAAAAKMRMIPVEMFSARPPPVEIDLLLRGDLSEAGAVRRLQAEAAANPGLRLGLAHSLDPTVRRTKLGYAAEFVDAAFALMADPRVRIVLPGTEPEGVRVFDASGPKRASPVGPRVLTDILQRAKE